MMAMRGGAVKPRGALLHHDPEKCKPVFRQDHAQTWMLEHVAIPCNRNML
jgi:hypothetical protein